MRLGKIYICSNEQNGFLGFRQWIFKTEDSKFEYDKLNLIILINFGKNYGFVILIISTKKC